MQEPKITQKQEQEFNKWRLKLSKENKDKSETFSFVYLHGKISSIYASIGEHIIDLTNIK